VTQKQKKFIWEMLPVCLIAVVLLAYIVSATLEYSRSEQQIVHMDAGWMLSGEAVDELPLRDDRMAGEVSVMSIQLDARFARPQAICFYSVYADVQVMLDGWEIYSFHKPSGSRGTQAPPSIWNVVQLDGDSEASFWKSACPHPMRTMPTRSPRSAPAMRS